MGAAAKASAAAVAADVLAFNEQKLALASIAAMAGGAGSATDASPPKFGPARALPELNDMVGYLGAAHDAIYGRDVARRTLAAAKARLEKVEATAAKAKEYADIQAAREAAKKCDEAAKAVQEAQAAREAAEKLEADAKDAAAAAEEKAKADKLAAEEKVKAEAAAKKATEVKAKADKAAAEEKAKADAKKAKDDAKKAKKEAKKAKKEGTDAGPEKEADAPADAPAPAADAPLPAVDAPAAAATRSLSGPSTSARRCDCSMAAHTLSGAPPRARSVNGYRLAFSYTTTTISAAVDAFWPRGTTRFTWSTVKVAAAERRPCSERMRLVSLTVIRSPTRGNISCWRFDASRIISILVPRLRRRSRTCSSTSGLSRTLKSHGSGSASCTFCLRMTRYSRASSSISCPAPNCV